MLAADFTFNELLAYNWAPIHYQDTDTAFNSADLDGRSDYITNIDFEGDWNTLNNWESAEDTSLPGGMAIIR